MNEHQRRLLDIVEMSSYIATFADPSREIVLIEPYTYSLDQIACNITSLVSGSFDLVMNSDSDFVVTMFSGGARIQSNASPSGPRIVEFSPALLVQILDQASGKTYFNQPTPLPMIAGAMGFPFLLTSPRVIKPRTTLTVTAVGARTNIVNNDFFFSLHGAKIFYA